MRIRNNKKHLVVNKEYSRLPYWTDDGYEDVQKSVSQKYVQDTYGAFAESENQLPYLNDADYQGLEYQYQNPEYFDPLDLPDVDLTNTAPKGTCYELWNSLFGHRTGAFIPTSGEWSALREYNKKCPLIYMPRTCCSESTKVDSFVGVNGPVKRSESNIKIHGPSTVKVNETAEYSVSGGLIGCAYELDVEGDGNMVGSTFYAPSTPGTAVIYVKPWMSDDQHKRCDFITVTIESGACTGSIGYTTLQMSVSGSQTLTVVNPTSGETYYWSTTSGSLSASEGTSVVFTAPASNANCANNPTITLTCGGSVVDTVEFAVNQVPNNYAAYEFNGDCQYGCKQYWLGYYWNCEYYYQYEKTKYWCSGDVHSSTVFSIINSSVGCNYTNYPSCTKLKNNCDTDPKCADVGGCCNAYTPGLVDLRTSAQKAAGCCPAQLM